MKTSIKVFLFAAALVFTLQACMCNKPTMDRPTVENHHQESIEAQGVSKEIKF